MIRLLLLKHVIMFLLACFFLFSFICRSRINYASLFVLGIPSTDPIALCEIIQNSRIYSFNHYLQILINIVVYSCEKEGPGKKIYYKQIYLYLYYIKRRLFDTALGISHIIYIHTYICY